MLTICTWWWGDKYGVADVRKLYDALKRNVSEPFRFLLVTDKPGRARQVAPDVIEGGMWEKGLLHFPGCLARICMFDPAWQRSHGVTNRLVCIDLDVVVTGSLDPLFDREEDFLILQGANASNPCPFNGSLMMLRHGAQADVWFDFSFAEVQKIKFHEFPDDQGWIWHKIPNAAGWKVGPSSGIYAFQKPGWPKETDDLPQDARLVVFPGWRSPEKFARLPWVKEHWHA